MTGSELATYVKRVFKRTDKDTELYEAATDVVVDMSLRLLADLNQKTASLSGISSVGDYQLDVPADFGHALGIQIQETGADDTYPPLFKISKADFDHKFHQNLSATAANRLTGRPTHYAYFGQKFYIGPAVDKTTYTFTLNYTDDQVADIVSGTASVPFTDKYRSTLRAGVLKELYYLLENFAEAQAWEAIYERDLAKIQANDEFNADDYAPMAYHGV